MVIMSNGHGLQHGDDSCYQHGITLEPFLHQVAGRATLMCLNETTVCKPLNCREHFFYKSLPPDIQPFTPRYKGVINVNIEETSDGFVALTGFPFDSDPNNDEQDKCSEDRIFNTDDVVQVSGCLNSCLDGTWVPATTCDKRIKLRRTGSVLVSDRSGDAHQNQGETIQNCLSVNPWSFKVHKEGLKRHLHSNHRVVQKFILLENVVSRFKKPCVLDLKMGTQVHGDYDDEKKKRQHKKKCATTTTMQLGVRLAGMQVFDPTTARFHCWDKYYGRTLDRTGLQSALRRFFQDGPGTRYKLLLAVLQRLRAIRDRLERLRSFRFYSSSLLIMYDAEGGKNPPGLTETPTSVSCPLPSTSGESSPREEFSVDDVIPEKRVKREEERKFLVRDKEGGLFEGDLQPTSGNNALRKEHAESDEPSCCFDIRMIDFAKSTHRKMDSLFVHDGPDHGYIFGLTNLIKLLKEIAESSLLSTRIE